MKIILSRKGFDSSLGRAASPILPSGELCSLPIPDNAGTVRYRDVRYGSENLGTYVRSLTGGRIRPNDYAHLDPDINPCSIWRQDGWKGLFGQAGAAEGHLRNQGVGEGDIFLFYGWFRQTEWTQEGLAYSPMAPDLHVLYGWLQIEKSWLSMDWRKAPSWASYHCHFKHYALTDNDRIFVAADRLSLPGLRIKLPGAGIFKKYHPILCLTAPGEQRTIWKLPPWFNPRNRRSHLSYHGKLDLPPFNGQLPLGGHPVGDSLELGWGQVA